MYLKFYFTHRAEHRKSSVSMRAVAVQHSACRVPGSARASAEYSVTLIAGPSSIRLGSADIEYRVGAAACAGPAVLQCKHIKKPSPKNPHHRV